MKSRRVFHYVTAILLTSSAINACIWDTDTLAMERNRLPEVMELITGNFPRHSREFHEWRRDRCKKLIGSRAASVTTYDDLAVSLHKLGDHQGAIAIMQAKDLLFPNLYETHSNLGTFHIYAGDLEEALKQIHAAVVINPEAHFGREKYQHWLVEWVQERKKTGIPTLDDTGDYNRVLGKPSGFAHFVARKQSGSPPPTAEAELSLRQLDDAIYGVSGMMRFADFDNPLLLEALGDLLLAGDRKVNAAQLATLSYLHASRKATTREEQERLLSYATKAGLITVGFEIEASGKLLDTELAKGQGYAGRVRKDELAWIAAGKDAGAEFHKKYLPRK